MLRAVTATVAAGWGGFLSVEAATLAAAVLAAAGTSVDDLPLIGPNAAAIAKAAAADGNPAILATLSLALAAAMLAVCFLAAAAMSLGRTHAVRRIGGRFALAGTGLAAFAAVPVLAGTFPAVVAPAPDARSVFGILAVGALAVLLDDRLDEAEPDAADDADFAAASVLIGRGMVRSIMSAAPASHPSQSDPSR